ncbi:hypothetical protein SLS62_009649 [Diatrype stigma]|uniref:Uncharacterized protein n=1 Tax=Diatrype stigma TaxID=117547 RepID=A0AAN9YI02_9PEZI
MNSAFLITDIKEKETTEPKAPSFPQIKSTGTGFPEHKKRTRISAFKQKRQGQETKPQVPTTSTTTSTTTTSSKDNPSSPPNNGAQPPPAPSSADESIEARDRRRIDRENSERLGSMSPEEVEAARQELFSSLDSATLSRLLKRANLDESNGPSPFDQPSQNPQQPELQPQQTQSSTSDIRVEDASTKPHSSSTPSLRATVEDESEPESEETKSTATATKKRVHFESPEPPTEDKTEPRAAAAAASQIDDTAPPVPQAEHILHPTEPSITRPHWPHPPQPDTDGSGIPDPSDPDFLEKLHQKYFPSLPADPSKLAWMAPIPTANSAADLDSPYHPNQPSVAAAALRFDFRGALLPPRIARAIPVTKGLHHHGEAPEAAGYTIPELARLARSAVPGQRCVAYQTAGRILYRLGRGEFGRPGVDNMADGIWALVQEGALLRSLKDEASLEEGRGGFHRSARAFAVEAVWLFEKGGWGERVRRGK